MKLAKADLGVLVAVTFRAEKVATLLHALLGRNITSKTASASEFANFTPAVIASYNNSEGKPIAICLCDLGLVLNVGAALCLIPAYEPAEKLKAKELDPGLLDNFKEVLNVCNQLFVDADGQHPKLAACYLSTADQPEAVSQAVTHCGLRRDLLVSIAGYANGRMSICT